MRRFLIFSGILFLLLATLGAGYYFFGKKIFSTFFPEKNYLVIAFDTVPKKLDPLSLDSRIRSLKWNVYEGLFSMDSFLRPAKKLVLSYVKSDEKTWKFSLRQNVFFHNETEMKAQDVVSSMLYAKKNGGYELGLYLESVEKVEALDSYTVQIVTKEVDPLLPMKLAQVPIIKEYNNELIGTGPYVLEKIVEDSFTFERFPKYYGAMPSIEKVVVRAIGDKFLRTENMKMQKIDILASVPTGREHLAPFLNNPQFQLKESPTLSGIFLMMNPNSTFDGQNNDLSSAKVRNLIFGILDRKQIAGFAEGGYAKELKSLLLEGMTGYQESFPDTKIGKDEIEKEFAEKFTSFSLVIPKSLKIIGEYIKSELEPYKIFIDLKILDEGAYMQEIESGKAQAFLFGWEYVLPSPEIFFQSVFSSNIGAKGSLNGVGIKDTEILKSVQQIAKQEDESKRAELLTAFQTIMREKAILFPLIDLRVPYLMHSRVEFSPRIDGIFYFDTIILHNI